LKYFVEVNGREHEVELIERLGILSATVDGKSIDLDYENIDGLGQLLILSEGNSYGVSIEGENTEMGITIAGHMYAVRIEDERERAALAAERAAGNAGGLVKAVMPGIVVELLVAEGDTVTRGQPLLILEAMKMQNEIEATSDGVVGAFHVEEGQAVGAGDKLVRIDAVGD
jgi:biotin carboxyl carrier protein